MGLIAIKDIPVETDIFVEFVSESVVFEVETDEINKLDPNIKKLLFDYHDSDDEIYTIYLPSNFKYIHLLLCNHSDNHNTQPFRKAGNIAGVMTLKPIKEGEEIFINYQLPYNFSREQLINYINKRGKSE